jgi:dTDP-glucose 4,6-dehydratase
MSIQGEGKSAMKVLVTGGAGFIGSNFVSQFTNNSFPLIDSVIVLDKLTYAGSLQNIQLSISDPRVVFINGDICNFELVNKVMSEVDSVINFAAESHVDRSIQNSADFIQTNVLGTRVLLESARINKIGVFLQVSTDEVYGSIDKGSWNENSPLLPNSPYSASKASADLLVRAYHVTYGLSTIVTRCSNNYGPRQFPEKLIPFFISRLLAGKNVPLYGDGLNVRDWLHVNDHCYGIYIAITKGTPGEVYNIGGGLEIDNLTLTKRILRLLGFDDDRIEFTQDRLGHDLRYSVDWSKIQKLGYAPTVSFEDGLRETVRNYQSHFENKSA